MSYALPASAVCFNLVPEDLVEKFLNLKYPLSDQLLKNLFTEIFIMLHYRKEGEMMNICEESMRTTFALKVSLVLMTGTPLLVWERSGE